MPFAEGVPTVDITLGGKIYTLAWTWAAKKRAREYFKAQGKDSQSAIKEENIAVAFWAGLDKDARGEISVEDIEELIHPKNEEYIATKMGSLFEESEPAPDPNARPAAVKEPTAGRSALRKSGQSASTISG